MLTLLMSLSDEMLNEFGLQRAICSVDTSVTAKESNTNAKTSDIPTPCRAKRLSAPAAKVPSIAAKESNITVKESRGFIAKEFNLNANE